MNIKRTLVVWTLAAGTALAATPPQDKARVAEIAAKLRPEAGFAEVRAGSAYWKTLDAKARVGLVAAGETALKTAMPRWEEARFFPREGKDVDDSTWASMIRASFERVSALAFAELAEDKGRFLPVLEESIDAVGRIPTWTGFYHDRKGKAYRGEWKVLELGNGIQSEVLSIVLDSLRDRLSPDCRARAIKALRAMTLDTYLALAADTSVSKRNSCGWYAGKNNWNAACNRYFTSAVLHVLDDRQERAAAIEFAERTVKRYLTSFTEDGLCLEGPGYWSYGFGNYLSLALWVRAATGDFLSFVPEPFLRACYLSSYETDYTKGRSPMFGDCNVSGSHGAKWLGRYVWADCAYIGAERKVGSVEGMLQATVTGFAKGDPTAARPYEYPLRSWFPDRIGQLICRPVAGSEKSDRIYVAIQGGYCARPHGHHDVGSYSIAPGGVEVMGDLGNSKYTYDTFGPNRFKNPLRNSYGHPVPRVNGSLQSPGEQSFASVVRSAFSDGEDSVTYDLTTAYRDAKGLKRLERTLRYRRATNEVDVVDHVVFDGTGAFETAFTTTGKVEELGDGVYRYTSRDGAASACCRISVAGAKWHFAREELPGEVGSQWNTAGKSFKAYRQAVVLDEPVGEAMVTVTWFAN